MAITIYDLAKEAHVSIATVSKALNNSYTISDKTRERIQTLARQMNYQPNARARSFARQKNGTVLFAADLARGVAFENPHLFEIINGVERRLDEKGYSLLIKHVPPEDAPERICSLMQSEQADGVMLHAGIREVSYLWGEELAFCSKFAPFVGPRNIEPLIAEIESAAAQIAQNGNPTIVFTHFALSVSKMIKHL